VRDYLDRLVGRVQQPEFVVQPRPISRFESPSQLILEPFDPSVSGVPSEAKPQSDHVIPDGTRAGRPEQHNHGIHGPEREVVDPISEAQPTQEGRKPYPPGQLTTEQSHVTQIDRTEAVRQSVPEVAISFPVLPSLKQSEPFVRRGKEPSEPAVRIEKPAQAVVMTSSNPTRDGEPSKLDTRVVQEDPGRIYKPAEIDEQTRPLGIPLSNLLGTQDRTKKKVSVSSGEQEWVRPPVRIGKPEEKSVSPLSVRMGSSREMGLDGTRSVTEPFFHRKRDLMPIFDVAPMSGRDQCNPFTENTAPQLATERIADSPTIQVTIGRVEIRATVASTPIRKPPTKSSTMSLDDYLTQRNGGRR
jgi:hypothetical protein